MIEFLLFFGLLTLLVGFAVTALVYGAARFLRRVSLARRSAKESCEVERTYVAQ